MPPKGTWAARKKAARARQADKNNRTPRLNVATAEARREATANEEADTEGTQEAQQQQQQQDHRDEVASASSSDVSSSSATSGADEAPESNMGETPPGSMHACKPARRSG